MVGGGPRNYDVAMTIYLDGEPVALGGANLDEVLAQARVYLQGSGRVVVEVQVDGQALTGKDLDSRLHADLGQAELRLASADPRELSLTALQAVRTKLAESTAAQGDAADAFQRDDYPRAMQVLGQAMQVWNQGPQAIVNAAQMASLPLGEITVEGQTMDALAMDLVERLKAIRDRLAAKDTVALADALVYEWPGVTARWDRFVEHLIQEISARP
jgi:hypothetical protein